jgi:hypothetical protein
MAEHDVAPLGEIHIPYNWSYANASARTGATGLLVADVGKFARQTDNNTIWLLTDDSPVTWVQVGGPPGVGIGDVVGPASATDNAITRYDGTTGKLVQNSNLTLPDDAAATEVGYINLPQNSQSADYAAVITDRGKHLYHPASDDNPRTFTIPANASVAFVIGTAITFINDQNTLTIAITSDTLVWAQDGSTGSRTLAENGIATAVKVTATRWIISGVGLS